MGEKLVDVYYASGEVEAYIIKGKLEANGIPCIVRSNASPSVYVFLSLYQCMSLFTANRQSLAL